MKKMILAVGAIVAAAIVSSCAGIMTYDGTPAPLAGGIYSQMSINTRIQDVTSSYTVVKNNVSAEATLTSYFTIVSLGDASFEKLKGEALKEAAGADDLIDIRVDYDQNCICGINTVTVKLTGTAIKYK